MATRTTYYELFIGSVASTPFSDEQWEQGTLRIIDQLHKIKNIYLIESNPVLGFNGPDCLMKKSKELCNADLTSNTAYLHVAEVLRATTQKRQNLNWIATADFVCPNGKCEAIQNEIVVFRDSQHLTASFTASVAKQFLKQMNSTKAEKQ